MSIKTITTDDLRRMKGKEGLILQGCGGDPQEWLDGINDLLTKEGILLGGTWLSDYVPNRLGGFEGDIPDEDCDEDMDEGFGMRQ